MGLVLTEAMCLGVPCISADFEVAHEQIVDKRFGIIEYMLKNNIDSLEVSEFFNLLNK